MLQTRREVVIRDIAARLENVRHTAAGYEVLAALMLSMLPYSRYHPPTGTYLLLSKLLHIPLLCSNRCDAKIGSHKYRAAHKCPIHYSTYWRSEN